MSGRRWLRAASDTQWVLAATDNTTGVQASPTVAFTTTVTNGATVRVDASGSFSTNGPITAFLIDFGDGTQATTPTAEHTYAVDGTYSIRVSLTDALTRTASRTKDVFVDAPISTANKAPTAALVATASGLTALLDASNSTDPDGTIATYQFSFGDGTPAVSQTTAKISHAYAKAGTYTATVLVTDDDGATASTARTFAVSDPVVVNPGDPSTPYVQPWKLGNPTEGLPSSVRVVPWSALYNRLSATDRASEDLMQLALNQMAGYLTSIGASGYAVVDLPDGFDYEIPGFKYGSGATWGGFSGAGRVIGLIGGLTNGVLQARLRMRKESMTAAQLDVIRSISPTDNGGGGYTTNGFRGFRFVQDQPAYLMGLQIDGADMQVVTDYRETGPANWGGIGLYRNGTGTIVQNVLMRGFGKNDASSPPGEVSQLDMTRDISSLIRRVEIDGRIPSGERRGGGLLWSASNGPTAIDVWMHDAYASGVSFSFAGSIADGNLSRNILTTRLRATMNANHKGNLSGWRFAAINQENPQATITHNQPSLGLDDSTRSLWDSAHMTYSWINIPGPAGQITVNDPIVEDAAKGGAYSGDNGCFSIRSAGVKTYLVEPVVKRNGVPLTAWVRTGAGAAPSYVTPDKYWIWKKQ